MHFLLRVLTKIWVVFLSVFSDTVYHYLQHAVDFAIMQTLKPAVNLSGIKVKLRKFPFPPHEIDYFELGGMLEDVLMIIFLLYSVNIVKDVLTDKESKMKVSL